MEVTIEMIADEALVTRFQQGDRAAFSELFQRHQRSVSRLVSRMLGVGAGNHAAAAELEDLVQDVFIQVYRSLEHFRGQSRLSTWIYRVAVNVVLMHRRSARSRPTMTSGLDGTTAVDPRLSPHDEIVQRRNVEALYRHLAGLSEKKRTVYILHEIEGLSPAEIAKVVDAPTLTVRTRLFYARRELLAAFREDPTLSALMAEFDAAPTNAGETNSTVRIRAPNSESHEAKPMPKEKRL
ncbi:MAG TPA: sigma-70 family RNA polymerase sigma factor [Polyangiaceae bacterium]